MKTKKSPKADLEKMRSRFFQIGLIVSAGLVLAAFEWTTFDRKEHYTVIEDHTFEEVLPDIQEYVVKDEAPKVRKQQRFQMDQEIEVVEKKEVSTEVDTETPVVDEKYEGLDDSELDEYGSMYEEGVVMPDITLDLTTVSVMPEFPGNMKKWLGENMKYPPMEREEGIQGPVYVEFTVGRDGKVRDVRAVRGPSDGLKREAERVFKSMPEWEPARQLDRKVSCRFTQKIMFKLH